MYLDEKFNSFYKKQIDDSKMYEKKKGTEEYKDILRTSIEKLKFFREKKKASLINVFKLDNEEGDMELAILRSFLNSNL